MKRLAYLLTLVFVTLVSAALITTATAMTLASYYKNDKNSLLAKEHTAIEKSTASR